MPKPDFTGIVSGHIFYDEVDEETHVETTSFINTDDGFSEAFCDIDSALLEHIETHGCADYWFIAIVTATFTQDFTPEGTEYDVGYTVQEINNTNDLPTLGIFKEPTPKAPDTHPIFPGKSDESDGGAT